MRLHIFHAQMPLCPFAPKCPCAQMSSCSYDTALKCSHAQMSAARYLAPKSRVSINYIIQLFSTTAVQRYTSARMSSVSCRILFMTKVQNHLVYELQTLCLKVAYVKNVSVSQHDVLSKPCKVTCCTADYM